jgi:hypothetical protein
VNPKISGLWDRFEASVLNDKAYDNPYADVDLSVRYTRPDGSTIDFWGFYDGDGTWRIRCMPDQLGRWEYDAIFSDGSLGASGAFACEPSDIPGMISLDETNPVWFGYKGGGHVLIRSLHVGDRFFADADNPATGEAWDPSRRTAFLDWAQEQRYNMLSVASHYLNRDKEGRGLGWRTPDLWDAQTQTPNCGEYRRMEAVLDDLASRKMLVYPFAGFFGRDSDYPTDPAGEDLYIRYTLARLGAYWNLLFVVGGPEPLLRKWPYLTGDDVDRLGRKIGSLDAFGHVLSAHNPTGDDAFGDAAWTSYTILQGPKTTDRGELSVGVLKNHHPSKPLYAQETLWPGNKFHPPYTDADIRKNGYVLMMSAAALNLGDMDGDSSSGFSGTLDLSLKVQSRHDIIKQVWDLFETLAFHRMIPRQELVDNGYCLADTGREYLVYLEEGGTVNVTVEEGDYLVEWINAQAPSDVRKDAPTSTGENLTSPTDGDDWLVHLERSE